MLRVPLIHLDSLGMQQPPQLQQELQRPLQRTLSHSNGSDSQLDQHSSHYSDSGENNNNNIYHRDRIGDIRQDSHHQHDISSDSERYQTQSDQSKSSSHHEHSSEEEEGDIYANCIFCSKFRACNSFGPLLNKALYSKYSSSQNYFYSKDINDIIAGASNSLVIMYNDIEVLSEEQEYLKRWYPTSHQRRKLQDLTEYYKYHKDIPRLFMANQANTMNRFHDKRRRIEYHRIKVQLNLEPDEPSESSEESSCQEDSEEDNNQSGTKESKKKKLKVIPVECNDMLQQLDVTLTFHERQKQTIKDKSKAYGRNDPEPYSMMNPYFLKKKKEEQARIKNRKKTGFNLSSVLAKPNHANFFAEVIAQTAAAGQRGGVSQQKDRTRNYTDTSSTQLSQIQYRCETRQDFLATDHSIPHIHSVLHDDVSSPQIAADLSYLQSYQIKGEIQSYVTPSLAKKNSTNNEQRPQGVVVVAAKNLNFSKKPQPQQQYQPQPQQGLEQFEVKIDRGYSQYSSSEFSMNPPLPPRQTIIPVSSKLTSLISEQQKIHEQITYQLQLRGLSDQHGASSAAVVALSLGGIGGNAETLSNNIVKRYGTSNMNGSVSTSIGSATQAMMNTIKQPSFSQHSGGNLKSSINEQPAGQQSYGGTASQTTVKSAAISKSQFKGRTSGTVLPPSAPSSSVSSKGDLSTEKRHGGSSVVAATVIPAMMSSIESSLIGAKSQLLRHPSPSQNKAAVNAISEHRSKKTQIIDILTAHRGSKDILLLSSPQVNGSHNAGQWQPSVNGLMISPLISNATATISSRDQSSPAKKKKILQQQQQFSINNNYALDVASMIPSAKPQTSQQPFTIQPAASSGHYSSLSPPAREFLQPQQVAYNDGSVIAGSSRIASSKSTGKQSGHFSNPQALNAGEMRLKKKKEAQMIYDPERFSQSGSAQSAWQVSSSSSSQPIQHSESIGATYRNSQTNISSSRQQPKAVATTLHQQSKNTTISASSVAQPSTTTTTHSRQASTSNIFNLHSDHTSTIAVAAQVGATSKRSQQQSQQTPVSAILQMNSPHETVKAQQFKKTSLLAQTQLLKSRSSSNPKQLNTRVGTTIQPSPLPLNIISSSTVYESKSRLQLQQQQHCQSEDNSPTRYEPTPSLLRLANPHHSKSHSTMPVFFDSYQRSSRVANTATMLQQEPQHSTITLSRKSSQVNFNQPQSQQQPLSQAPWESSSQDEEIGSAFIQSSNIGLSANHPTQPRTRSQEFIQISQTSAASSTNINHPSSAFTARPSNPASPATISSDYQKFQILPKKPSQQNRIFASASHHSHTVNAAAATSATPASLVAAQQFNAGRSGSTRQFHQSNHVSSSNSSTSSSQPTWKQLPIQVSPIPTVRNGSFAKTSHNNTNGLRVESFTARVSNIANIFDSSVNSNNNNNNQYHQSNNFINNTNNTSGGGSSAFSSQQFNSQNPVVNVRKNSQGNNVYYSSPPQTAVAATTTGISVSSQPGSLGSTFPQKGSHYSNPSSFFIIKSQSSSNHASQDHVDTSTLSPLPQPSAKQKYLQQQQILLTKREAAKQKQSTPSHQTYHPRTATNSPSQKFKSSNESTGSSNAHSIQIQSNSNHINTQLNLLAAAQANTAVTAATVNPTKNITAVNSISVSNRAFSKASSLIRFRQPNNPY